MNKVSLIDVVLFSIEAIVIFDIYIKATIFLVFSLYREMQVIFLLNNIYDLCFLYNTQKLELMTSEINI